MTPVHKSALALALLLALPANCQEASAAKTKVDKTVKVTVQAQTESQIRAQVEKLAAALASGDAPAIAALWSVDGVYTASDGSESKGRAAIQSRFGDVISSGGKQMVMLDVGSVRRPAENVVMVEGFVRRRGTPISISPETRFSLLFIKQADGWYISSASETPVTVSAQANPMLDLSWMIGDWQATNSGASVMLHADWAANKNFIVCNYLTQRSQSAPKAESKQVIGWDPRAETFVSWHFDSNGGYGHGIWEHSGKKWIVRATGMERDGARTASANFMVPLDADSFTFQSVNRSVEGQNFSDGIELTVRRLNK